MQALIEIFEISLHWLGAIAGVGTLAYAVYNTLLAQRRPTGYHTGAANQVLRTPYLVIATLFFVSLAYVLWKPLPFQLQWLLQLLFVLVGGVVYYASLALYLWGLRTLGLNFNTSSGFGVRLQQDHQLVTQGPYAYIRHPMYLAVILACWGGLLLYYTWTMLVFAVMMLGLIYRAGKEEEALTQAFGEEWEAYKRDVPGWIPHKESLKRKITANQYKEK
jgi:protein-S-isoprenylcysteine O-methyltransferase Ste14